jgi:MFS transporter, putative metabolite:H+ symporter
MIGAMKALYAAMEREGVEKAVMFTAVVAALGYMVDIFDLLLFSIVRVQSLKDLGIEGDAILTQGIVLINSQMAGLMLGGILWGVLGDRMGRVSVLFGSILLYSLANIANAFVQDVPTYALLRFIAGIGLAGELGAGVTLASELLPKHLRGLGTAFIATIGMIGAVLAAVIADITDWRTAYVVGGAMGLCLLALRLNVKESGLYQKVSSVTEVSRGNFLLLFRRKRLLRYLAVILIGAPIWGVVGIFITFTPEFATAFGMAIIPKAGTAVLFCYAGLLAGDLASGVVSQILQSRRKTVAIFLGLLSLAILMYIIAPHESLSHYYGLCFAMGAGAGYWAMFVQMGAEQFGTNIRATAATSIPNMVRGLTVPMTAGFHALIPAFGVIGAGVSVLVIMIILAAGSLFVLPETFKTDLDYTEN